MNASERYSRQAAVGARAAPWRGRRPGTKPGRRWCTKRTRPRKWFAMSRLRSLAPTERRGRDSNPGYGNDPVQRFSKPSP